jgi:hypothetical protein
MTDQSSDPTSAWCDSVVDLLHPESLLILGGPEGIASCFVEKNISAVRLAWDDVITLSSAGSFETLLADRFGAPQAVLALIPLAESGSSLPEISRRLHLLGYSRDLGEENGLLPGFFTAIYRKSTVELDQLLLRYEAECWRLAQLSQKRRALLAEYMTELAESGYRNYHLGQGFHTLQDEIRRHEEWSKTLQQEVVRITAAYNDLLAENAALKQGRTQGEVVESDESGEHGESEEPRKPLSRVRNFFSKKDTPGKGSR